MSNRFVWLDQQAIMKIILPVRVIVCFVFIFTLYNSMPEQNCEIEYKINAFRADIFNTSYSPDRELIMIDMRGII